MVGSEDRSADFTSNSLPILIVLMMFFLMLYVNHFMIRRRGKEFAVYLLSGIGQKEISLLYLVECSIFGIFSLLLGIVLLILLFFTISTIIGVKMVGAVIGMSIIKSVAGYFFVNAPGVLLGSRDDFIMGYYQFYIAVLFIIAFFSISSIQQIVDSREHNQKLLILNRMGMSCKNINKILLKQVILNFFIPVIMAIILLVFSAFKLNGQISGRLGMQNGVILGLGYFLAIFLILMSCYIFFTYQTLCNTASYSSAAVNFK